MKTRNAIAASIAIAAMPVSQTTGSGPPRSSSGPGSRDRRRRRGGGGRRPAAVRSRHVGLVVVGADIGIGRIWNPDRIRPGGPGDHGRRRAGGPAAIQQPRRAPRLRARRAQRSGSRRRLRRPAPAAAAPAAPAWSRSRRPRRPAPSPFAAASQPSRASAIAEAEAKRSAGSRARAVRVIAASSGRDRPSYRGRVRDRSAQPGERHRCGAVALPRPDAGQHLVQDDAQAVDVRGGGRGSPRACSGLK